jgi:hypothetical protein
MRKDGQTDKTKLIVAFRNFTKSDQQEKYNIFIVCKLWGYKSPEFRKVDIHFNYN